MKRFKSLIAATTAATAVLALAPAAGGAELAVTTGLLPETSVGGGAVPQLNIGGGEGGALPGISVDPGLGTQPGQTPATQPQQQQTQKPKQGSSSPSSGGKKTAGGSRGGANAEPTAGRRGDASKTARKSSRGGEGRRSSRARERRKGSAATTRTGSSPPTTLADDQSGNDPSVITRFVERIPPEYQAVVLTLGGIAILFGLLSLYALRRSRRAQEDALSDSLTGLANRQAFEQRLDLEWKRATRYEHDLGLLLLDLDGFKRINDTEGHVVGDRVLRETAAAISTRVRETDFPARFGGDEFVVICPETGVEGLRALAEGLEAALGEANIAASVGYAERRALDAYPVDVVARADKDMYRRKRESYEPRMRGAEALAVA